MFNEREDLVNSLFTTLSYNLNKGNINEYESS